MTNIFNPQTYTLKSLGLITAGLILALSATGLVISKAQAAVSQDVSYTWVQDVPGNCYKVDTNNPTALIWTAAITNNGPGNIFIEKAAFHSPVSGCAATSENLDQTMMTMTGKINFTEGESGETSFTYNTSARNCGRVQLDAAYRNADRSGDGMVFLGEIVDYGVDCSSETFNKGQVIVTSNVATAWVLSGPENAAGTGKYGSYTLKAGSPDYFISASNISGYKPARVSPGFNQTLNSGQTIVFDIFYESTTTIPEDNSCLDNAAVSSISTIPNSIAPGSSVPFSLNVKDTGTTWWHNGSYYQLIQTTALNLTPSYGHISPAMLPNDEQQKNFTLTAPSAPGTYSMTFQMVHRAGGNTLKPNGQICATAKDQDVLFGNAFTITFTVLGNEQHPAETPTGTIVVTSNLPTTWTVSGPVAFNGNGTYGSYSAPAGSYFLNSVPQAIEFNGNQYQLAGIQPTSQNVTVPQTVLFQITYNQVFTLNAPTITGASNEQCGELTLKWLDNSNNESGFHIYRSETENGGDYTQYVRIATAAANTTSYTDKPALNKSYFYIVASYLDNPAKISPSAPYRSSFNTPCTALVEGSMTIAAVNGQTNFDQNAIKDNDVVTLKLMVDNLGPAEAYVTRITDTMSITLKNPRNLTVTGPNANIGSPAIGGSYPNLTFNVSGKKEVGGMKWVITFDGTVDLSQGKTIDQFGNCATVHYFDQSGNKTKQLCLNQILAKTQKNGAVKFREVAP